MIPILAGPAARGAIDRARSRGAIGDPAVSARVAGIIDLVRREGDGALRRLAAEFGEPEPPSLLLSEGEVAAACGRVPAEAKGVIARAAENIRAFAEAVVRSIQPIRLEREGFAVGLDYRPVASCGCYVPGGRHPLPSSALMTAIAAAAAGVGEITIASPRIRDEVVCAGTLAGVTRFHPVGGAQAIAALALGTQTVRPVDMIVGPGNAFVTEAKRQLFGAVGIDLLAGPSEVVVIADGGADPSRLAAELLAQAEHGPDSKAWLMTESAKLAEATAGEAERMLSKEGHAPFVRDNLGEQRILVFGTIEKCVEAANDLAPEHLVLAVAEPERLKGGLANYGALFMGYDATVAFGDYMSGPNHTLPTGTTARFSEGLNPRLFLRARSWFLPTGGISGLARDTAAFASLEGLPGHALAARARIP